MDLIPKNTVITGAAQGLGRAIALRLAVQDKLCVALNDLPNKQSLLDELVEEIKNKGGKAVALTGDATDNEHVEKLINLCVAEFGSLDVMVCNAGTCIIKPVLDMTDEEMNLILHVNFRSIWTGYRAAARQMIKQGKGGRILGASSQTGKRANPEMGVYSATKFAIRGLTQAVAQEWGVHGITVNTYSPGLVWTPLVERFGQDLRVALKQPDLDPRSMWAAQAALGRIGEPEDIANLVSFMASKDSAFITGQSFGADGGTVFD